MQDFSGPKIDFYVEAGAVVGMGHLSRASSLIKQLSSRGESSRLYLYSDQLGRSFARERGLALEAPSKRTTPRIAVIDAVALPQSMLRKIAAYPVRIVISPAFRSLNLATHYLARSRPISNPLSSEAYLDVNSDYAFVTSSGAEGKKLEIKKVSVGICLTAGRSGVGFQLAEMMLEVPSVEEVRVISRERPPKVLLAQDRFVYCRETLDPWSFFADCSRFIGGDGLMVSEAVALQIPTFSLVADLRGLKNLELVSKGAILPFTWGDARSGRLGRHLTDERVVGSLQQACKLAFSKEKSEQLAKAILAVVQNFEAPKGP